MDLSNSDVAHVAKLARVGMSDVELERATADMRRILEYMATLDRLDLSAEAPIEHLDTSATVLATDDVVDSELRQAALDQSPEPVDNRFRVPKVV